jgi:hypothetical protein
MELCCGLTCSCATSFTWTHDLQSAASNLMCICFGLVCLGSRIIHIMLCIVCVLLLFMKLGPPRWCPVVLRVFCDI